MKITRKILENIIKEEIERILLENVGEETTSGDADDQMGINQTIDRPASSEFGKIDAYIKQAVDRGFEELMGRLDKLEAAVFEIPAEKKTWLQRRLDPNYRDSLSPEEQEAYDIDREQKRYSGSPIQVSSGGPDRSSGIPGAHKIGGTAYRKHTGKGRKP